MKRLRELFDLFEQRSSLMRLLDVSNRADGVQIFIGGESGIATLDECSVVAAPYAVDGQIVGSVGVIGPTRMAYERVIPIVDITAKLLSSALSNQQNSDATFPARTPAPTRNSRQARRSSSSTWAPRKRRPHRPSSATSAVPLRPARRRDSAPDLVADPERHHPQHPPEEIRREICHDLDDRRLAAQGSYRTPDQAPDRLSRRTRPSRDRRLGHALRRAVDSRCPGHGSRPLAPTRILLLPMYPQYAASTTATVVDDACQLAADPAQSARDALRPQFPRRPGLHRSTRPDCAQITG